MPPDDDKQTYRKSASEQRHLRKELDMHSANRHLFFGETLAAGICAILVPVTVVWPDWIERLTGFDPDHHSGESEWELVIGLAVLAVVFAVLARTEWRRLQSSQASSPNGAG